jgi:hypothetical protein
MPETAAGNTYSSTGGGKAQSGKASFYELPGCRSYKP